MSEHDKSGPPTVAAFSYAPNESTEKLAVGALPFRVFTIRLDGVDRNGGEFFPFIEGKALRVISCDLPCRFSMGVCSSDFAIGANPGTAVSRVFKGIVLFHPLMTPATANYVSTIKIAVYDHDIQDNFSTLPFSAALSSNVGNGTTAITLTVPCAHVPNGVKGKITFGGSFSGVATSADRYACYYYFRKPVTSGSVLVGFFPNSYSTLIPVMTGVSNYAAHTSYLAAPLFFVGQDYFSFSTDVDIPVRDGMTDILFTFERIGGTLTMSSQDSRNLLFAY